MVNISAGNISLEHDSRNPGLAPFLSLLPGLGQIYNGQARKGLLFLATAISYLVVFLIIIFNQNLIDSFASFGQTFHMKPDSDLVYALRELHIGSTLSFIISGLFLAFVAYSVKDAHTHANMLRLKSIYPDYALEMNEAASGSYLLHFVGIIVLFILAAFFLKQTHRLPQTINIEFAPDQIQTIKKINSQTKSDHASTDAGRHKNEPVVAPVHHSQSAIMPKFHPSLSNTKTSVPSPPQRLVSNSVPIVSSPKIDHLQIQPPTIAPTQPLKQQASPLMPRPQVSIKNKGLQGPIPSSVAPQTNNALVGKLPAPVSINLGNKDSFMPNPVPAGDPGQKTHFNGSSLPNIGPTKATSGIPGNHIGISPVLPRPADVPGSADQPISGNPPKSIDIAKPDSIKSAPADFGPYMSDLQRRIKRAWFPPSQMESKRVVVLFKIHTNGELTNLRLDHSSGFALADQAALKAVENAAPFRPLPKGSADDVDIQFTFDYNVFSGGTGIFKKF